MRVLALLAVLICVGYATAATGRVDILVLDTFDSAGDDNSCTISVNTSNQVFPLNSVSFFSTGSANSAVILGGERDLQLTAKSGGQFSLFSSDVSFGEWSLSTPPKATSTGLLQYDGIDGSINLNIKGFEAINGSSGGYDLTITSKADGIHLTIVTDLDTQYTFNIYDVAGGSSSLVTTVPGNVTADVQLLFSTFKGNVDFSKVGAIEVRIEGFDNVDTATSLFALSGPTSTPVSASPVPPPPGVSVKPDADTWYRFDDDDDGQSPCGDEREDQTVLLADYNIIYYYFYGFQRPYIYVSNPNNNDATLLIPSIFACILAFFAL